MWWHVIKYSLSIDLGPSTCIKAPTSLSDNKVAITDLQSRKMGGLCSKSSTLSGGHTLASPTPIDNSGRPQQLPQQRLPQQQHGPRQHPQAPEARRGQAAAAAERRMKAVRLSSSSPPCPLCPLPSCPVLSCPELATLTSRNHQKENKRGVSAANPNSGRLAAQLEASRTAPVAPEPSRREDTLIVSPSILFFFFNNSGVLLFCFAFILFLFFAFLN
jgi:hypothetical protein